MGNAPLIKEGRLTICAVPGCNRHARGRHCPEHRRPSRGRTHRKARAQTLLEEATCWLCGNPGTKADPLTADHIVPRSHGGTDTRDNYRAAHESCNKRRGAQTLRGGRRMQGLRPADTPRLSRSLYGFEGER